MDGEHCALALVTTLCRDKELNGRGAELDHVQAADGSTSSRIERAQSY